MVTALKTSAVFVRGLPDDLNPVGHDDIAFNKPTVYALTAAKRSFLVLLKLAMPGRISVNVSLVSLLDALARFVDHPTGRPNSAIQVAFTRS